MKFFNIDLHVSVIADIRTIFESMGHQVDDWTLSGHAHIFGRSRDKIDVINHVNWKNLDQKMCDDFYDRYKDELSEYDGFICTYAPSFCLLYEKFQKPIITIAPIRYEAPFWNDKKKWKWYNDYLKNGIENKLIIPVVNNKVDKRYCEMYTEKEWHHIPSLCEYTNAPYSPKPEKEVFLYSSFFNFQNLYQDDKIVPKNQVLKANYKWQDLSEYSGIIHIPYCPSTMSIFEQYTSSIPLFFPSFDFILSLREKFGSHGILNQLSWRETHNLPPSNIFNPVKASLIKNLNDYGNIDNEKEWIGLSDFYDEEWMPHIQHFNSFPELSSMLRNVNLTEISDAMKRQNIIRKELVYKKWDTILKNLV